MKRWLVIAATAASLSTAPWAARSEEKTRISDGVVKIGMIEDMSSIYADITGVGAVTAAKMAVEDFGGSVLGMPIEVVSALKRGGQRYWDVLKTRHLCRRAVTRTTDHLENAHRQDKCGQAADHWVHVRSPSTASPWNDSYHAAVSIL